MASPSLAEAVALQISKTQQVLDAALVIAGNAITQDDLATVAGQAGQAALAADQAVQAAQIAVDGLAGAAQKTQLSLASGASSIGSMPALTGGQLATVEDRLSRFTVSVFDFLTPAQVQSVLNNTAGNMLPMLQKALDASVGKRLIINAAPWKIVPLVVASPTFGMCLNVPSNITIEFEPGAEIQLLAHNHTIYQMMRVWDRTNVKIYSPRLNGRKDLNSAAGGEFGMGIDIRGGSGVRIYDPVTLNMWGDGIYYGESGATSPRDGYILKHVADGCRRQGMSIVAADGLVVDSPTWKNIAGTPPAAGLDIEPDNNQVEIKGIRIINPVTENCAGPGILIAMQLLAGVLPKNVDIQILNHHDNGSVVGFSAGQVNTNGGAFKVDGSVTSIDPVYENSKGAAFQSVEHDALGPLIQVVRPDVIDSNRNAFTAPAYGSPFVVLRDTGSALTYPIGNCQVIEPKVTLKSGSIPKLFFVRDAVALTGNVDRVAIDDPRLVRGVTNKNGFFTGKGRLSDRFFQMGVESGSTEGNYANYPTLIASNVSVSFDLSATLYIAGGPDIVIVQPYSTSCIVRTGGASPGTGNFVGMTVGQRLQANGKPGAYLRLRPLGGNVFMIVENVGPWLVI